MAREQELVAVVDDDPGVLRGVARLLNGGGYKAVTYVSARNLLAEINELSPSCIVADLVMPELDGLTLQETLSSQAPDCPVVFITGRGDIETSVQAMRNGAIDFITKPFDRNELLDAVARACEGASIERERNARLASHRERLESLTRREREVYEQVVQGLMNKQIAAKLGITEKTVKVHRARVMNKMQVRSVAKLARIAEQIGQDRGSH